MVGSGLADSDPDIEIIKPWGHWMYDQMRRFVIPLYQLPPLVILFISILAREWYEIYR